MSTKSPSAEDQLSTGFGGTIWDSDVPAELDAKSEAAALVALAALPVVVHEVKPRPVVPLLAGAGVALIGGLVWAGVVIASNLDIGILAWLVGGLTGVAIVRVAGGPIGIAGRVLAGGFAVAGIMVGKYVIFVHAVKTTFAAQLAAVGASVGYFDTHQMSIFVHNLGSIVKPIYALWAALAFVAAVRTAGGGAIFRRRRPRAQKP